MHRRPQLNGFNHKTVINCKLLQFPKLRVRWQSRMRPLFTLWTAPPRKSRETRAERLNRADGFFLVAFRIVFLAQDYANPKHLCHRILHAFSNRGAPIQGKNMLLNAHLVTKPDVPRGRCLVPSSIGAQTGSLQGSPVVTEVHLQV